MDLLYREKKGEEPLLLYQPRWDRGMGPKYDDRIIECAPLPLLLLYFVYAKLAINADRYVGQVLSNTVARWSSVYMYIIFSVNFF